MALSKLLPLSLLLLLISTCNATDRCTDPSGSSDISIFHIYGKCSPFSPPTRSNSWFDTVLGMARKDPARLSYLVSLAQKMTSVPIASGQQLMQSANYILQAKLGTPGQLMYMVLDTSSDAAWVPCTGCTGCPSSATFSPANSSTYASTDCAALQCAQVQGQACAATGSSPCNFNQSYGGDAFSAALGHDSLSLGKDVLQSYAFGCVNSVSGAGSSMPKQGLLGLGRGPTSLLAQSGSLYGGVFSYCLPSFKSYYFSGSLKLGPVGQPKSIRTTPLLRNPHRPSLYYANLTGISVGRTPVVVPPELLAFDPVTGAGTIVDSGTVISRFVQPVYAAVRDEYRRQAKAPAYSSLGAFDTCFEMPLGAAAAPTVTLHFEGMDVALPVENTLIHSSSTALACLAMAAAPANVNAVLNVVANLQQQNYRVLFDVANSKIGFARELCN